MPVRIPRASTSSRRTSTVPSSGFVIRAGPTLAGGKKSGDVWLYGDIGDNGWGQGIGAKAFADQLKALGDLDTLNIYVNSQGGDVFAGLAIYNILSRHPANKLVSVDGIAASIASVICMAGDEISMASNAFMMIHDPWTYAMGNSTDLRETADQLDKVCAELVATYARRSGSDADAIAQLMREETWMNADDAVANGFADVKSDEEAIAASVAEGRFKRPPAGLVSASSESGGTAGGPGGSGGGPRGKGSIRDRIANLNLYLRQSREGRAAAAAGEEPGTQLGARPGPGMGPEAPAPLQFPRGAAKPKDDGEDGGGAPDDSGGDDAGMDDKTQAAMEACHQATLSAHACVNASLDEDGMGDCVRACMDAAKVCHATMALMAMGSPRAVQQAGVCADACRDAQKACKAFPDHQEATAAADACDAAAKACDKLEK